MQMLRNKNLIKYIKLLIFFLIISYLVFKAEYNFDQIYEKINTGFSSILLIIVLNIIFFNLISLRMFLVFKLGLKKFLLYFNWSKLYFESLALNIVLSHTGTVYRAYELKKNNVQYRSYISFFYTLFFSYLILNMFFILIELIIFLERDPKLKIYCFLIMVFILIGFLILPKIIFFFSYLIENFLSKKKFKHIIIIQTEIISKIKQLIKDKDILIILFVFGLVCHLLEIILFYFSFNIFLGETSISKIILLFAISFILDRIPIIRDIPGFSEVLFATASIPFGFEFTYSLLTKFLLRFTTILAVGFNYILSLIISDFLYNKKKL